MSRRVIGIALVMVALVASSSGSASARPTDQALNQFAVKTINQKLVSKADAGKVKRLAREVCLQSSINPTSYWPSVSNSAVNYEEARAWAAKRKIKVSKSELRRLMQLALREVCPRSLVTLKVPTEGWQEVQPTESFTSFNALVGEGALIPLGNAWQLGGELTGYVTSGKWFEGAFFTVEMLDENLEPVFPNYVGVIGFGPTEVDPSRPHPVFKKSSWIGGYNPGPDYSPIGAGADSESLLHWANARFARVQSLTGTDRVLLSLRADPQRWLLTR